MVNPKYAFVETFKRPKFTAQTERVVTATKAAKKKSKQAHKLSLSHNKHESEVIMESLVKGGPNEHFLD